MIFQTYLYECQTCMHSCRYSALTPFQPMDLKLVKYLMKYFHIQGEYDAIPASLKVTTSAQLLPCLGFTFFFEAVAMSTESAGGRNNES